MRSTGEVMGIASTFARALGKALLASGMDLPRTGKALISVKDADKTSAVELARRLRNAGLEIVATHGTAEFLRQARVPATGVNKVAEGSPHVVDLIRSGEVTLVVNSTVGAKSIRDSYAIRRQALLASVPYFTTMSAALAGVAALEVSDGVPEVCSLQEWHKAAEK
jgi:carbamoyl-phosphate synthase large subunit